MKSWYVFLTVYIHSVYSMTIDDEQCREVLDECMKFVERSGSLQTFGEYQPVVVFMNENEKTALSPMHYRVSTLEIEGSSALEHIKKGLLLQMAIDEADKCPFREDQERPRIRIDYGMFKVQLDNRVYYMWGLYIDSFSMLHEDFYMAWGIDIALGNLEKGIRKARVYMARCVQGGPVLGFLVDENLPKTKDYIVFSQSLVKEIKKKFMALDLRKYIGDYVFVESKGGDSMERNMAGMFVTSRVFEPICTDGQKPDPSEYFFSHKVLARGVLFECQKDRKGLTTITKYEVDICGSRDGALKEDVDDAWYLKHITKGKRVSVSATSVHRRFVW